jgi:urea transporter
VYGTLFGIGKVVLGDLTSGALALGLAAACGAIIAYNVARAERSARAPLAAERAPS